MSKPLDDYYRHPRASLGRDTKCKECAKRMVSANYGAKRAQYSAYERERAQQSERRQAARQQTKLYRERHPERARAHRMVAYYKHTGALVPRPCDGCGAVDGLQAHHHDYTRPLDVTWLCFKCHRERGHGQVVTP